MAEQEHYLELHITYLEHPPHPVTVPVAECPKVIGRGDLELWLGLAVDSLSGISRSHFTIDYLNGRFYITDTSTWGTLVEPADGQGRPQRYNRTGFTVIGQKRLRLQNDPADVVIDVREIQKGKSTKPVFSRPPDPAEPPTAWERLLRYLAANRAVHLFGLPGIGKSFLAARLVSQDPLWIAQRDAQLNDVLGVLVDGNEIQGDPAWQELALQILLALRQAAQGLRSPFNAPAALEAIDQAQQLVRSGWAERPQHISMPLLQALKPIIQSCKPILIFDHFDDLFSRLEPEMLFQLYQLHRKPDLHNRVSLVLITRRPLRQLRQDSSLERTKQFTDLFVHSILPLGMLTRSQFDRFLHRQDLSGFTQANAGQRLYDLSGGHPGLAVELLAWLTAEKLLTQPERWDEQLTDPSWFQNPSVACEHIWSSLSPEERQAVLAVARQQPADRAILQSLQRLTLVNDQGRLFSPIFEKCVPVLAEQNRDSYHGLQIDLTAGRVYSDGEEITGKLAGLNLRILLYLFQHQDQVCSYQALYEACWGMKYDPDAQPAINRAVSRLRREIDDVEQENKTWYYVSPIASQGYILRNARPWNRGH